MTYAKGSSISASDFNDFAGTTLSAAGSAAIAQNKAGYLFGIGYGDRGYFQSAPSLSTMGVGASVGQEWQNLRTVMASMAAWQNTSTSLLPPSTSFNSGSSIIAHEQSAPSSNVYDINGLLATLDANRLNYQLANMSLTTGATSTRSATWGAGSGSISCTFQVTFSNEDHARKFFNTGGEIRIQIAHPSTATARDASWNTVLNGLSIAFRANTTARIGGSYGTAASIGYYQLSTTVQTILNGTNTGLSPYSTNDFFIEAWASSIPGINGAKGSVLNFRVRLVDEQTNAFQDVVQSGTNATIQQLRATSGYAVSTPSFSVASPF